MPSINLMCLVLCLINCIVMYIATLPPSAERISNVLSLTLHLRWIAKYLSQTVTTIDISWWCKCIWWKFPWELQRMIWLKNKKILPIIVSVIAMLSVICISSFTREKPPKKQNDINNIAALSSKATADTPESDEKMRGVWVSYMELSMENESSKTQKAFEDKFTEIAQKCSESGFNTLIVQVRPFCDALYKSSYFPWSHILTGTQGENPQYDALQIMCDICKENNLKIHAWINPCLLYTSPSPRD